MSKIIEKALLAGARFHTKAIDGHKSPLIELYADFIGPEGYLVVRAPTEAQARLEMERELRKHVPKAVLDSSEGGV